MYHPEPDLTLDAAAREAVIAGLLERLEARYVFPDVAAQMAAAIHTHQDAGDYADITSAAAFCERLTADMQAVSHDKHLHIWHSATPLPPRVAQEDDPAWQAGARRQGEIRNFGFVKVERLPGNVGYLDLWSFAAPEFAGETAVAAMAFLAHTHTLIIDLRHNGGGWPEMVALLTTYLFPAEIVHLNSLYWREGDSTQQFWTLPWVPGRRYADKPVYVLTSGRTFSGAEEFANNLKELKRATLVGEVTGGGANPGDGFQITPHFEAFIPTGRAINPVSGRNWEGTGVTPDIEVPADEALTVAYRAALQGVLAALGKPDSGPLRGLVAEAEQALAELGDPALVG